MLVEIYRGPGRVFGCVAAGNERTLPARFAPWTAFRSIELVPGQKQPGLNVEECLDDIATYGVHVTDAHVRITEQALS